MELTKVYVVQADNNETYEDYRDWMEGVFASKESAEKYIENEKRRYDEDMRWICELEELNGRRRDDGTYDSFEKYGWTAEEFEEYEVLQSHWCYNTWECCPHYWIKEFEVKS